MPWIDKELLFLIAKKDHLYKIAVNSGNDRSAQAWENFRAARNTYKSKMRQKMENYFLDKTCSNFKSSKKYWSFYKSVVKTKNG